MIGLTTRHEYYKKMSLWKDNLSFITIILKISENFANQESPLVIT